MKPLTPYLFTNGGFEATAVFIQYVVCQVTCLEYYFAEHVMSKKEAPLRGPRLLPR